MQLYNALGKPVKTRRYVITREDPLSPRPYSTYLAVNGFCGFKLERAARFKTEKEAQEQLDYFAATYPRFVWKIETA